MTAKVLLCDIETAPALGYFWGLFNQNIGLEQVVEDPRIMGVGAGWYGKSVMWRSEYHHSRREMLDWTAGLLDEADIVVHYNGKTFDTPWVQGELMREGIAAPSPFKQIDLYQVIKKHARFLSHKLAYVAPALVEDTKITHSGFRMWKDCLLGEGEVQRKAYADMRRYCKKDTALLGPLLDEVRPYLPTSINFAVYEGNAEGCQKCGKDEFLGPRGWAYTAQGKFRQFYCYPDRGGCGGWSRSTKAEERIAMAGVVR